MTLLPINPLNLVAEKMIADVTVRTSSTATGREGEEGKEGKEGRIKNDTILEIANKTRPATKNGRGEC